MPADATYLGYYSEQASFVNVGLFLSNSQCTMSALWVAVHKVGQSLQGHRGALGRWHWQSIGQTEVTLDVARGKVARNSQCLALDAKRISCGTVCVFDTSRYACDGQLGVGL